MKKSNRFALVIFGLAVLLLTTGCRKSKTGLFYFDDVHPAQSKFETIPQASLGYPPLLRPTGKRMTIKPDSQFFTLAIPNCIDMSGRAQDLRKSLADMLYTQIFETGRFNLYDRWELVDLNPEWLETSLKQHAMRPNAADQDSDVDESMLYLQHKEKVQKEMIAKLLDKSDGLLVVYITSRTGQGKGGQFVLDYRIVSTGPSKIVLFAGSKPVRYKTSTSDELRYNREDIQLIAEDIVRIFPSPNSVRKGQIISVDSDRIVLDIGKDQHLIPGLRGFVVSNDDSIYTTDKVKAQQFVYLSKFQIVEVYDRTSTAQILPYYCTDDYNCRRTVVPPHMQDYKVGDLVILK